MEPIEFRKPFQTGNAPELPELLYGTVQQGDNGFYIEEWDKGVCFRMPDGFSFPVGTSVIFVIPPSGGFIEDQHSSVIDVEKVVEQ